MYVDYESYRLSSMSEMTEDEYARVAPVADLVVDHWTLGRVGRAVGKGEELPQAVAALYCAVADAVPDAVEQSRKAGKGGLVTSFSNGVDSFSFDASVTASKRLYESVGWMLALLPVEWCSGIPSFEGGSAYVG